MRSGHRHFSENDRILSENDENRSVLLIVQSFTLRTILIQTPSPSSCSFPSCVSRMDKSSRWRQVQHLSRTTTSLLAKIEFSKCRSLLRSFDPEFAFLDHLDEKWCRCILLLLESFIQDVHDVEYGIETDQIRESKSGPIGWFIPNFMMPSMASGSATPS